MGCTILFCAPFVPCSYKKYSGTVLHNQKVAVRLEYPLTLLRSRLLTSEHGVVGGLGVWLPCACSWAGDIRREYATTLGELVRHRLGLVGDILINYFLKGGRKYSEKLCMTQIHH